MEEDELTYNEKGFAFALNEPLTDYLQGDLDVIPPSYMVFDVIHEYEGPVSYILIDVSKEECPIADLGPDEEMVKEKLDMFKLGICYGLDIFKLLNEKQS